MIKTNSVRAWVLAARPKTLTGAVAPVLLGAAFAYARLWHDLTQQQPDSQTSILHFFKSTLPTFFTSSTGFTDLKMLPLFKSLSATFHDTLPGLTHSPFSAIHHILSATFHDTLPGLTHSPFSATHHILSSLFHTALPPLFNSSVLQLFNPTILPFLLCLLFAILMQIDANLINDYFDFRKGSDREDRLGPERACAQGWVTPRAMCIAIGITTFLSCLVGLGILFIHLQWELLGVGALCVLFSFLYTTKLSYLGWGDLLVLVFFGLIPVIFTYYVLTGGGWNIPLVIASVAMGLATDNLLIVNNYRDRYQDEKSGKRTIIVRLLQSRIRRYGTEKGRLEGEQDALDIYLWLGIFATLLAFTALFLYPYSTIRYPLMLIYLILHFRTFRQLKTLDGKALNQVLGATARNIFLFGLLLGVSVFL